MIILVKILNCKPTPKKHNKVNGLQNFATTKKKLRTDSVVSSKLRHLIRAELYIVEFKFFYFVLVGLTILFHF